MIGCRDSVISQTYFDWELLIVDDCSTDKSSVIVDNYLRSDSRIRYLKTDKCSGSPAFPRNLGKMKQKEGILLFWIVMIYGFLIS